MHLGIGLVVMIMTKGTTDDDNQLGKTMMLT